MLAPKSFLESITDQAARLFANDGNLPHHELEKQFKGLLQNALGKLDVVSRDEFDGQMLVLQRTRQRMEALEARIDGLEAQLAGQAAPSNAATEQSEKP